MSQDFLDPELLTDFIVEAKEHLETIEPNLLELEKAPDNLSLLNEIFRPMHSFKGASGFLGLNRINKLAHKAENILDALRKGSMFVNADIMDVILNTTDALRQMIDSLEKTQTEGDIEVEPLMTQLDALMEEQLAGHSSVSTQHTATQVTNIAPTNNEKKTEKVVSSQIGAEMQKKQNSSEHDGSANNVSEHGHTETITDSTLERTPHTGDGHEERSDEVKNLAVDVKEWLETLPRLTSYPLTAFGEEHLKDFIEEAHDNISSLTDGLLELEKKPKGQGELINDLFRYFHNLKGNSGIIAFAEINSLTHEAETLLNAVRKDEYPVSSALVDFLLFVVDVLDALITSIDTSTGHVTPFAVDEILEKLRQAVAGQSIELPESLQEFEITKSLVNDNGESSSADKAIGANKSLLVAFSDTIGQQLSMLHESLAGMKQDGSNTLYPEAMYRALSTLQNSCKVMELEELREYAERTAAIVKQGMQSNLDFSLMTDLLSQEIDILNDMLNAAIENKITEAKYDEKLTPSAPSTQSQDEKSIESTQIHEQLAQLAPPTIEEKDSINTTNTNTSAPHNNSSPASATGKSNAGGKNDENTSKASATIRVDHEKLDHLMNLIGELIINRNRYALIARQLEESDKVNVGAIAQNLSETTYAMARISDDLQDTIMKVRMVPVASVFSRFPRLVRDLSRKSGKEVELIIEGDDTELDKSVVEVIGDPLVHLIRNSMDHGIEPAEIRQEAGKELKGKVYLRAYYKGNAVIIEVEDDGKGINPDKMREVAIKKGIISQEEAKQLEDREAVDLIFAPGFSSAEVITDISGRGVGMDVVRTNIKNLKGSISIQTEIGKGTKFTLQLPLTLAIIDALMVKVAAETFAIPLDAVSETTKIEASRLTDVKGRKAVTLRGEVLGIVSLAELLGLPSNMAEQEVLSVVVVHDNDRRLGLVVDRLLERQEIVIKPLGSYLGDLKGISGATIIGDGSVILILEPHEIYLMSTSKV